jgi:hypothetical protein
MNLRTLAVAMGVVRGLPSLAAIRVPDVLAATRHVERVDAGRHAGPDARP